MRLGADEPDGEGWRLEMLAHRGRLVVLEEGEQAEVGALVDAAEYGVWVARAALQGHRVVERVGDRPEKNLFIALAKIFVHDQGRYNPNRRRPAWNCDGLG